MIETEDRLEGSRLQLDERFRFRCGPGLPCFNSCCRDKRLPLFPYDMLRLRQGLSLPSQEVLARHVELELDPGSGWPALRIKLLADGRCPFVGEQGCQVYADRPACCRIFPLARAVAPGRGAEPLEVFLVQQTPGCLGWQEPRELTVQRYLDEQALAPYREANNRILELFMHPSRPPMLQLDERQIHAVIMALYNLDVFRQAVAAPGFAGRLALTARVEEPSRLAQISDESLLWLGQGWIADLLFGPVDNDRP